MYSGSDILIFYLLSDVHAPSSKAKPYGQPEVGSGCGEAVAATTALTKDEKDGGWPAGRERSGTKILGMGFVFKKEKLLRMVYLNYSSFLNVRSWR